VGEKFFPLVESYRSHESAELEAANVRSKAGDRLHGRRVAVLKKELPEGTFYRVVVEPATTRAEVLSICRTLAEIGFRSCSPILP
jgi:hypothetical protein